MEYKLYLKLGNFDYHAKNYEKEIQMESYALFLFTVLVMIGINTCTETKNPVCAENVEEISDLEINVTTKTLNNNQNEFIVQGNETNNGDEIYPVWYIECDFYTDSTFKFKLGGEYCKMNYSLDNGETTSWRTGFASDKYIESDYEYFAVKNIRAYKNEE